MMPQLQIDHMKVDDMLYPCQNVVPLSDNVFHGPHEVQHNGHIVKIQSVIKNKQLSISNMKTG